MSRPLTAAADAALGPVRSALLTAARADAAAILGGAEAQRGELLGQAQRTAAELIAEARSTGAADATALLAIRLAQSRREARRSALTAQRELYDELRRRCRAAASALAESSEYEGIRRRLVDMAREQLGPEAVIEDSPGGGVVASAGSRRMDLSLPALADRALERSGPEVAALWTR
ncbi:V-type ATP synthase subunit E family protein [Kribbella sp. HUAS MG21]|jgi:vacuolar-type H+-ATPase subunit E/Vma4|uniref:V-type ATP synthase subunit E family protein n=1 Tax=Kribbella sp. HUAS MG21 TaxID=3160966 RepID=A0AAU7T875_9ACTN